MISRNFKNVLVVSIGFLSLFTAYGGLQSLQVGGKVAFIIYSRSVMGFYCSVFYLHAKCIVLIVYDRQHSCLVVKRKPLNCALKTRNSWFWNNNINFSFSNNFNISDNLC